MFLFLIYSSNERMHIAEHLYNMIRMEDCVKYIVICNPLLDNHYNILNNKYIVLKTEDTVYSDTKCYLMFHLINQQFQNIKCIIKCNDNIIPNIMSLTHYTKYDFDYMGNCMGNMLLNYMNPMFIMNINGIKKYCNNMQLECKEVKLYCDKLDNFNLFSFININTKYIYVILCGRLGNQLFQIASGYGMSKKHKRIMILTYDGLSPEEYSKNIFSKNLLYTQKIINNSNIYSEIDNNNFMTYNPNIINDNDIILHGYFQNEKYFKDYKNDVLGLFNFPSTIPSFDGYFIHIRRGDYKSISLFHINYDIYYTNAINHILKIDKNATFIILSDDINYCKQYEILDNINKTFIDENTINSLCIMSNCIRGGICCNSTFSWWGGYLNKNINKKILFPSKWFDNKSGDIYFENSIIINCDEII